MTSKVETSTLRSSMRASITLLPALRLGLVCGLAHGQAQVAEVSPPRAEDVVHDVVLPHLELLALHVKPPVWVGDVNRWRVMCCLFHHLLRYMWVRHLITLARLGRAAHLSARGRVVCQLALLLEVYTSWRLAVVVRVYQMRPSYSGSKRRGMGASSTL